FHDLWRLEQAFAQLHQERDVAVGPGGVIPQAGIRELLRATLRAQPHEVEHARVVPLLGRQASTNEQYGDERRTFHSHARKVSMLIPVWREIPFDLDTPVA